MCRCQQRLENICNLSKTSIFNKQDEDSSERFQMDSSERFQMDSSERFQMDSSERFQMDSSERLLCVDLFLFYLYRQCTWCFFGSLPFRKLKEAFACDSAS